MTTPTLNIREKKQSAPAARNSPERGVRFLEMSEVPEWDALVERSPQGSLFCRSWWIEAIAPQTRILGYFEVGRLVAGIPLMHKRQFGFRTCGIPKYNPSWGVVMEPISGKQVTIASREMEILRVLASEIAKERIFYQSFHPTLQNWLPFYWNGFKQTSRFTYIIYDLSDLERVWDGFTHSTKGEIRKAEKLGLTVEECDISTVQEAERKTFARQGLRHSTGTNLAAIYDIAKLRGAAQCFAVKDQEGTVHAANLLVWDSKAAYFLAGGADPKLRKSGATSFLIWHLINFASPRTQSFDFEGSVVPSIERFFRSFGGQQVPYSWIMKFPFWLRCVLTLLRKP
jgi:hypothetical protein